MKETQDARNRTARYEPGVGEGVCAPHTQTPGQLDNLAHMVVAALFILMAATVLIHTGFLFANQVKLIVPAPEVRQETGAANGAPDKSGENHAATPGTTQGKTDAGATEQHTGSPSNEAAHNDEDPFNRVSLELLSTILFAVIILELLRTIITYLQTHNIQAIMQEFLVVGIISSVRKILLVGAEASLSGSSGDPFVKESTGVLLNIGGILLLIVGLVMLRGVFMKKKGIGDRMSGVGEKGENDEA